jgi:predicted secreted hydrolase
MPAHVSRWIALAALAAAGLVVALVLALRAPMGGDARAAGEETAPTATMLADMRAAFEDRRAPPLSGPWRLSLPEDHGAHPEAGAETWAVYAQLEDAEGAPVSAILTLSRFGLAPDPAADSAWAPRAAWVGQAALALTGDEAPAEERLSRGAGAAGHDAASGSVWLDDWVLRHPTAGGADAFALEARVGDLPLELSLAPLKPPVAPGEATEAATRGFAMTRLEVEGRLGSNDVAGVAWIDRLWGDLPAPGGPLVYDRMILHLDDGTDLSILRTRRRDGRGGATLDGVVVGADGAALALPEGASWTETDALESWRLTGPDLELEATALPGSGPRGFAVPVWHGGLRVEGTRDGQPVTGSGTVLLSAEATP